MKYKIHSVNDAKAGDITFNTGKLTYVRFAKGGGNLSEQELGLLSVFKRDGKWQDGVFLRAVKSGRLEITGDEQLEAAFKSDVPAPKKPVQKANPSVDAAKVAELEAKLAEVMARLDAQATSKRGKAAE